MAHHQANQSINQSASNFVVWFARHWLAIFNVMWAIYILLPLAAPLLMAAGLNGPARVIYAIYSIFCHQLPDHSYFLGAQPPELAPSAAVLQAGGMPAGLSLFEERRFIGNSTVGYKVAVCQRDVAIYGSILLAGLAYGALRHRIRGLNWRIFVLLALPMAIDGVTQMFGWRESTWFLRSLTGALFGFGAIWFLYPFIQVAMDDVIVTEERRWQAARMGEVS